LKRSLSLLADIQLGKNTAMNDYFPFHGLPTASNTVLAIAELHDREAFLQLLASPGLAPLAEGARKFGHHEGAHIFAADVVTFLDNTDTEGEDEMKHGVAVYTAPPNVAVARFNAEVTDVFRRMTEISVLKDGYRRMLGFMASDDISSLLAPLGLQSSHPPCVVLLAEFSDWTKFTAVFEDPEVNDFVSNELAPMEWYSNASIFGADLVFSQKAK